MKEMGPYCFPPDIRLRKSADFQRLRNSTHKLHTRHFLIVLEPALGQISRLGLTVSTKIDKRSVQRNRIKRLVREVFRTSRHRLARCFDIVVIARKNTAGCTLEEVKKELLGAFAHKGFLIDEANSLNEN